jgi:HlyD family secretion protein
MKRAGDIMKKKLGWAMGVMLVLALLVWAFVPQATEVELASVTEGRFERTVQEDGKTRLRERYVVATPLTGRVDRIVLKQGDVVAREAVLATLWPTVPALLDERSRDEHKARIASLEASATKAHASVGRAGAALDQARADQQRSETLAQAGFISPNQNDVERLNVRLREKELDSARQDEVAARHEIEYARIALRPHEPGARAGRNSPWPIKAPVAGKVLKIYQQSKGLVQAGTPLLDLGDPTQLEVVVDILTEDATQIAPGTPVLMTHWGGPQALQGRVRLVEPAAFTKVSALGVQEQRVNAVIEISTPPEQRLALGDGFKVDVQVLVQVVDRAVMVPVSALFPVGARSALFVVEGGRARQREVQVGARNGTHAWITSGLTKGAQVIVYPPATLTQGASVVTR